MTFNLQTWMTMVRASIMTPAIVATDLIARRIDSRALWIAIALIAVLNVLFLALMQALSPIPVAFTEGTIVMSPFATAFMIAALMTLLVFTTLHIGRVFGGQGNLNAVLTVMVWFHSVSLTLEVIQIGLLLVSPLLSTLWGMASLVGLFWCIINFVNVLHGFNNLGKAALTFILALFAAAFVAGMLLIFVGAAPAGETI